MSADQFWKAIGDYLNKKLVTDELAAGEFSVLAGEGDRSQMAGSIYLFREHYFTKSSRKFLGVVELAKSKKAEDLHDIIMKLLEA